MKESLVSVEHETKEPLLLTVKEAANLTRISRSKFYEMMLRGEIPSVTIGRSRRVPMEALKAWISDLERSQSSNYQAFGYC